MKGKLARYVGVTLVAIACAPRALISMRQQESREQLVARVSPAVVLVQAERVLGGKAHGSGFIYDASGLILTNQHVIEGARRITVRLSDGRTLPATLMDYYRYDVGGMEEHRKDTAILKIDGTRLPVLSLEPVGRHPIARQGQEILILGYPGGLPTDQVSVTRGIVSAVRTGWIQTDAVMIPGNSGGPAIDLQGRVLGLATFGAGRSLRFGGITLTESFRSLAENVRTSGYRARTLAVDGLEYVDRPRFMVREWTWDVRFEPESGPGEAWTFVEAFGSQQEDYGGAIRYSMGRPRPATLQNMYYSDSTGFYRLGGGGVEYRTPWNEGDTVWISQPPQPIPLIRLPLQVDDSWEVRDVWHPKTSLARAIGSEYPPTVTVKGVARVERLSETVTVAGRTYDECVRIAQELELIAAFRSRTERSRLVETTWYAPRVGSVRVVARIDGVGSWTRELKP